MSALDDIILSIFFNIFVFEKPYPPRNLYQKQFIFNNGYKINKRNAMRSRLKERWKIYFYIYFLFIFISN